MHYCTMVAKRSRERLVSTMSSYMDSISNSIYQYNDYETQKPPHAINDEC